MMNSDERYTFDRISILNSISERKRIIEDYKLYGILNREDAIRKIQSLRFSDKDIAEATVVRLSVSNIPFTHASDQDLVSKLQMQIDILSAKILANA